MDVHGEIAAASANPMLQPTDHSPRPSGDYRRSVDANRRSFIEGNRLSALDPTRLPPPNPDLAANRLSTHSQSDAARPTSKGKHHHLFGLGHGHKKSKSREIAYTDETPGPGIEKTDSENSLIQMVAGGPVDGRAADAITAHTHARNIEAGVTNRSSVVEAGPAGTTAAGPSHAPEKKDSAAGVAVVARPVSPQAAEDALELDRLLAGLKEDPMGAVQLGEDGVMRSFIAQREIVDAVGLSPRLIKVWFARMPPGLRDLLDEAEYEGVEGTLVPPERMFRRDVEQLPPPISRETLDMRRKRMEERQLEDEGLHGANAVNGATESEANNGGDVQHEEVNAAREGRSEGHSEGAESREHSDGEAGRRKARKGSRERKHHHHFHLFSSSSSS